MTPTLYCQQKGAPLGSSFYFALKSYSKSQRAKLIAAMAFYREIESITLNYNDLHIAQLKLNWWREEILKIKVKETSHPVALRLQELNFDNVALLNEIMDGVEQNLTLPSFENFEEVMIHFMRTAGNRELLFADILQLNFDKEFIYQLAFIIEFSHYLQHLRTYVKAGLVFFPHDEMEKYGIKREDFFKFKTTTEMQDFLNMQIEKILKAYDLIKKSIPDKAYLIRCKHAVAILKAIQEEKCLTLEKFIDITPLYRWWIAR